MDNRVAVTRAGGTYGSVIYSAEITTPLVMKECPEFRDFSIGEYWPVHYTASRFTVCYPRVLNEEEYAAMMRRVPDLGAPWLDGEFAGISISNPRTIWLWKCDHWSRALHSGVSHAWPESDGALLCDLMLCREVWYQSRDSDAKSSRALAMPVLLCGETVICLRRGFESYEQFNEHLRARMPKKNEKLQSAG